VLFNQNHMSSRTLLNSWQEAAHTTTRRSGHLSGAGGWSKAKEGISMESVEKIDSMIGLLRASIGQWEKSIHEKRADLARMGKERDGLRRKAIRDSDQSAQRDLDVIRNVHSFMVEELADYEAEIERATAEVEALIQSRVEALKAEAWDKWQAEAQEACKEAAQIEKFLDGFITTLTPHRERLARMSRLAKEAGSERPTFDMRHLWRRFTARMHRWDAWAGWGRQDKAYDESYAAILKRIFDVADQQQNPQKKAANG
jgi:hypothetical protein